MVAGPELAGKRAEDRSHAGSQRIAGFRAFEEPETFLEHADRRIAVSAIDVAVVLAGKSPLGSLGLVIDEPRIDEQRFRGFTMGRAVEAAAYQLGGLAPARWLRAPGILLHQLCTHGRPAAFQPPTVARWPSASRLPSNPSATFQ